MTRSMMSKCLYCGSSPADKARFPEASLNFFNLCSKCVEEAQVAKTEWPPESEALKSRQKASHASYVDSNDAFKIGSNGFPKPSLCCSPIFDSEPIEVHLAAEGEAISKILSALDALPNEVAVGRVLGAVNGLANPAPLYGPNNVWPFVGKSNGQVNLEELAKIQGIIRDEEESP